MYCWLIGILTNIYHHTIIVLYRIISYYTVLYRIIPYYRDIGDPYLTTYSVDTNQEALNNPGLNQGTPLINSDHIGNPTPDSSSSRGWGKDRAGLGLFGVYKRDLLALSADDSAVMVVYKIYRRKLQQFLKVSQCVLSSIYDESVK